jgi:HD-like signal output (HDOD) protein
MLAFMDGVSPFGLVTALLMGCYEAAVKRLAVDIPGRSGILNPWSNKTQAEETTVPEKTSAFMNSTDEPNQLSNLKSHILRSLAKLPPMPQIILKAQETMANPNAGLRDLARIIENDQALVAKVLSLANSAYYGISGQVSSVQHASILLGLKTLGDLITMSATSVLLTRELKGYHLAPQTIWRHSLSSALCARRIAERLFPGTEADAFVVGLLHDAGKIILDPFIYQKKENGEAGIPDAVPVTESREVELLGVDHAEVMALACRFWRFPDPQVRGIRFHHHPAQSSQSVLAHVAHLGHTLSLRAGFGGAVTATTLPEDGVLEFLNFQPADLDELQAEMIQALERLEETFQ